MINTAGLSLDQAPPLLIPFKFFFSASLFAVAIGLLLVATGDALYVSRWSPQALALTHLVTVGFLAQVMSGAMFQLLPVMIGTPLPSVVLVGRTVNLGLAFGAVLLSSGFLWSSKTLLVTGAILLCVGFGVFLVAAGVAISRASVPLETTAQFGLGWLAILPTALLGLLSVLALVGLVQLNDLQQLVSVHLSWGLLGWVGIVLFAVLFKLVPMFYVTREMPSLLRRLMPPAVVVLLMLFTLTLFFSVNVLGMSLLANVALFCLTTVVVFFVLHRRKRAIVDATLLFIWTGLACLLTAAVIWVLSEQEIAVGLLVLAGVGLTIPIGVIYKVLPFLCWYHLQGQQLKRNRFEYRLPPMKHFIPERSAKRHYLVHMASIVLMLAGEYVALPLNVLPGVAFTGSALYLFKNIATAYIFYQRQQRALA